MVQDSFKGVFGGIFISISWVLQKNSNGVSRSFQRGCFKKISREIEECFKSVSMVLQLCFMVFQGCVKGILRVFLGFAKNLQGYFKGD